MTESYYHRRPLRLLIYLCPFVVAFAFALDIYIPTVADMRLALHTSREAIQLTLSLFLATNGIGQLLFGPLSDQIGRRPMLIIASLLFMLGNIICALAPNITLLITARIITAAGACGMLVTANAIVRDLYQGEMSARMYSLINTAISVSPIFAPIIGGHLAAWAGLRAVFWFLTIIGIIGFLIATLRLQETLSTDQRITINRKMLHHYRVILTTPAFLSYAIMAGCAISIFFAFFSVSPIIIIELFHVPMNHFGYYFAMLGITIAIGGILNVKWVKYFTIHSSILCGLLLIAGGSVMMLLWPSSLFGFIVPFIPIGLGGVFLVSSSASGAMEPFGNRAGYAAAMLGFLQFFIGALAGTLLMLFPIQSTQPYAIFVTIIVIIAALASA
ncbi:MAG: multidrug effflux MFS transporter [Gammaproteobacteria bacterium]|nr:multidrug effflux MFS transporter [Gammaproteobacteria bacterium]